MNTTNISVEQQINYYKSVTGEGFNYYYDIYRHPAPTMAPVLFVGGAYQDISTWKRFIKHFSNVTTVVEVDLPGSDVSEQLPINFDFDRLLEALNKLLDEENFDKVYLISASFGAPVVYQYVRNHRDEQDRLLMAGVLQAVPETIRKNIFASLNALEEDDIEQFIDIVLDGIEYDAQPA